MREPWQHTQNKCKSSNGRGYIHRSSRNACSKQQKEKNVFERRLEEIEYITGKSTIISDKMVNFIILLDFIFFSI